MPHFFKAGQRRTDTMKQLANWLIVGLVVALPTMSRSQEVLVVQTPMDTEHELVSVPAGKFIMGVSEEQARQLKEQSGVNVGAQEKPQREVFLDAYYIDRYEVTNALWNAFAERTGGKTKIHPDETPALSVTWFEARDYCEWAGLRLPSEAEWEKAARGIDGRTYPWGNEFDESKVNSAGDSDGFLGQAPVGSFPMGASPYGAYDMVGNAWEVVADNYDEAFYLLGTQFNPTGSAAGDASTVRGGSVHSLAPKVRTTVRQGAPKNNSSPFGGFRCARDTDAPSLYPELTSSVASLETISANQPASLRVEATIDNAEAGADFLQEIYLDLTPLNIDENLSLERQSTGHFVGTARIRALANGRYDLPLRTKSTDGGDYQLSSIPLRVLPDTDIAVYDDGLLPGWNVEERSILGVRPTQSEIVHTGTAACAIEVEESRNGFFLYFRTDALDVTGYQTLRFALHPGDVVLPEGGWLRVNLGGLRVFDLALESLIDMNLREWQLVELPVDSLQVRPVRTRPLETEQPVTAMAISGKFTGTFYLDDIQIVAPEMLQSTAILETHTATNPEHLSLQPNYPNPFNSQTIIRFALPVQGEVELSVFNLVGQQVATLVSGLRQIGSYSVQWDGQDDAGRDLASGIYLYRLQTEKLMETRRLLLLR
jgi:formylglycine-generating enzyme required for sulfatase activity